MASIVNSDNGVVSGTAGLKSSADSSGVLDLQTNGTTAISISASQVVSFANQPTYTGGTANGVMFLNGSKAVTTGTALTFDGSQLDIPLGSAGAPSLSTPTDPNTGMFFPAADTIAFAEGGVEAMRLDASGNLNMTGGGTANTANTFGFKNRIINGGMQIDQRNAGASVTAGSLQYTIDRWRELASPASKFTIQRNAGSVTPPVGFINYLGMTSTSAFSVAAADYQIIQQFIEGFNVSDLAWGTANAQSVTVSFWVRSSLTGLFGGSVQNSGNSRSYPFSYTINAANTWEQKSITIAGDTSGTWLTDNGRGLALNFSIGTGTNNSGTAGSWSSSDFRSVTGAVSVVATNGATFYITGVQLERGTQATSFDFRPYGTELILCQRYFESNAIFGSTPSDNKAYPDRQLMYAYASGTMGANFTFQVAKRAAPTVTFYSSSNANTPGKWAYYTGAWNVFSSQSLGFNTPYGFCVDAVGSGFSGVYITAGGWSASSEL